MLRLNSQPGIDSQTPQLCQIKKLPYEIIVLILQNLNLNDILTAAQVSHRWRSACSDASIWKNIKFSLYYEYKLGFVPSQEQRSLIKKQFGSLGFIYFMPSMKTNTERFVLMKEAPSMLFLEFNRHKLQNVRSLCLANCNDMLSGDTLLIMLQYLPSLTHVDLSGNVSAVSNAVIKDLVINYGRGANIETLNLKECSRLDQRSLALIGKYCKKLRYLDVSGMRCNPSFGSGLIFLIFPQLLDQPQLLNGFNSSKLDALEVGPITYSLETLKMNSCDYIDSVSLACFIKHLTRIPPCISNLRMIQMNDTFQVNHVVLEQIYVNPDDIVAPAGTTRQRQFEIQVRNCPQLMESDIRNLTSRLESARRTPGGALGCLIEIKTVHSCALKDDSAEAVRDYLRQWMVVKSNN